MTLVQFLSRLPLGPDEEKIFKYGEPNTQLKLSWTEELEGGKIRQVSIMKLDDPKPHWQNWLTYLPMDIPQRDKPQLIPQLNDGFYLLPNNINRDEDRWLLTKRLPSDAELTGEF